MDVLWEGLREAWRLLAGGDAETFEIIGRSLAVSLTATAVAFGLGLPLGMLLAFGQFPGRRVALAAVNTGMGLPPVVVGLFITVLLWRSGPLGALDLLYTPGAMVIAQATIAFPLVAGISAAALQQVDSDFKVQMEALGASRARALWTVAAEARLPLLAAVMAGFGAVVSEVGAAMMVGGNIAGETRVLTTAAVLEASRGEFGAALAFGIVLLALAFAVNLVLTAAQHWGGIARGGAGLAGVEPSGARSAGTSPGRTEPDGTGSPGTGSVEAEPLDRGPRRTGRTGPESGRPASATAPAADRSPPSLPLELRDVTVRAGRRTILHVPRLELGPGVTAVLGANGAGKSTLLRVAGALRRPDAGTVLLAGVPAGRGDLRRATAAVLQRPLLRRGSVHANVETGLRFRRVDRREAGRRAETWMERLGIRHLGDRPVHTLSGGEAQRVSLARALAVEPGMLLLDEPFAGLDAPTRGELLADLREALQDSGTAALLVTHDRHEAAALADRIAILHDGELRQHGPTAHVLDNPADPDCARILGFENLLRLLGGTRVLRAADCEVERASATGNGDVRLPAALRRVIPLGPTSRVVVDLDGASLHATAPAPPPAWLAAARPGDPVTVRFEAAAARPVSPAPPAPPP